MATGDSTDFIARLRANLPSSWFPSEPTSAPFTTVSGAIDGFATTFAFIYSLLAYAKQQTRIKTATDGWLDLIAWDFFGISLLRAPGQSDASFITSIITAIFRARNTRAAIISILTELTGHAPLIFEPWRDGYYLNQGGASAAYYGVTPYASRGCAFQAFIIAYRGGGVSDSQIYAAVNSVRTAGTKLWVQIQNFP